MTAEVNFLEIRGEGTVERVQKDKTPRWERTDVYVRVLFKSKSRKKAQEAGLDDSKKKDGSYHVILKLVFWDESLPELKQGVAVGFKGNLRQSLFRGAKGKATRDWEVQNPHLDILDI